MVFTNYNNVQQSMHLHLVAPICIYVAFIKHKKQTNKTRKHINMVYIYILKALYMHI